MEHPATRLLWQPSETFQSQSHLQKYMDWVVQKYKISLSDYQGLWEWSIEFPDLFWESIWDYFQIIHHSPYISVTNKAPMPDTKWFEGSSLNYVEHIFRQRNPDETAIYSLHEGAGLTTLTWGELEQKVAAFTFFLKKEGMGKGDRLVAYIPNIPEATIAFLACASLGIIWSSCSQDFGIDSVVSRFAQIEPAMILTSNGYRYGGKAFDRQSHVETIVSQISSIRKVIMVEHIEASIAPSQNTVLWEEVQSYADNAALNFEPLPFDHPIFILFSSGTTGVPKAITHGHGGMLLEHLKYLYFHNDVKPGERFFWYSTTGWMMWNFTNAALLAGAAIVLYDGSPGFPHISNLWKLAAEVKINHFGTSAPFIVACMKAGLEPGRDNDLSALRSIGSTGSPLPPEAFDYVYEKIKRDVWLCSMSGGTDVCTAFVGGNPLLPVYEGEIQCRTLGCDLQCLNEDGMPIHNEEGELVIAAPMPCMPVFFWNDPDRSKYKSSYFEDFLGKWRHGDWIKITPRNSIIIYGRSDATLNRQGVRIGTAEIYSALNQLEEVSDALIVNLEQEGGNHYMPLFVVTKDQQPIDIAMVRKIKQHLRQVCSPRHVPDDVIQTKDIPYTISGKKMEAPVKKILMGKENPKTFNKDSMRNPESMDFFRAFAADLRSSN